MKKTLRLRSCGFSIIVLLVSVLNSAGIKEATEDNIKQYLKGDFNSVSDFIEDNFSTFVSKYNAFNENKWLAESIEDRKPVINVTDNTSAVYLDFDGNNGYAVVGNDYNFLKFSQSGDLDYLKDLDVVLFSEYDGFVYETESGFARYDVTYADDEYWKTVKFGRYYAGQKTNLKEGSGNISDPDAYIKDRYGSGFILETSKRLPGYVNVRQDNYSYYRLYGRGEGNCTLSAMFGIMRYLRDYKGMNKFPYIEIDRKHDDSFYAELIRRGYKPVTNKKIEKLYATIRKVAINYGYTVESTFWTSLNMENIYKEVAYAYGYSMLTRKARLDLMWSFLTHVKMEIDLGYPVMWNTARGQYGAHSMVVNRYRSYYKVHQFWFIKWREYRNLMSINDNWNYTDYYFDLDAYFRNIFHECFGSFLKVRSFSF